MCHDPLRFSPCSRDLFNNLSKNPLQVSNLRGSNQLETCPGTKTQFSLLHRGLLTSHEYRVSLEHLRLRTPSCPTWWLPTQSSFLGQWPCWVGRGILRWELSGFVTSQKFPPSQQLEGLDQLTQRAWGELQQRPAARGAWHMHATTPKQVLDVLVHLLSRWATWSILGVQPTSLPAYLSAGRVDFDFW